MELHLLSDGYFTLDKSLLVYTKYQGQIYEAALKPLLIIAGKKKILVETGIGELPETYKKIPHYKEKAGSGAQDSTSETPNKARRHYFGDQHASALRPLRQQRIIFKREVLCTG